MKKRVLLTGGTGFIGSHTAVELLNTEYDVVIADDLSNSNENVIDKIEKITGKKPVFYNIDIADKGPLGDLFYEQHIDSVIHFAGYKSVRESIEKP